MSDINTPSLDGAAAGPVATGARIGHVRLKASDLARPLAFHCGVLGFELTQCFGPEAAFISAGGYHHHIGLDTWESRGGRPPAQGNGLELYWDRPAEQWPRLPDGSLAMFSHRLDMQDLLRQATR